MKISIAGKNLIILADVSSNVVFELENGERLSVSEKYGTFEIATTHKNKVSLKWYSVDSENEPKVIEGR